MSTLAAETTMPKKKDTISVQAHLTPEEHKEYHALVEKKKWSDKKLNEEIIRLFLKEVKKNPSRLNDL